MSEYNSAHELSEVLEVVSSKVPVLLGSLAKLAPDLVKSIINAFYSPEAGANIGKAVGELYKELVDSGMPKEVATEMARDYMISLKDITSILKSQADKAKSDAASNSDSK